MKIVGKCEKCGREFVTMPKNGRDAYRPANDWKAREPCGGVVKPVPASEDET